MKNLKTLMLMLLLVVGSVSISANEDGLGQNDSPRDCMEDVNGGARNQGDVSVDGDVAAGNGDAETVTGE